MLFLLVQVEVEAGDPTDRSPNPGLAQNIMKQWRRNDSRDRNPCVRNRIEESALYRNQDAPFGFFSQRWQSMEMIDISEWASDNVRTINMSVRYLNAPYELKVREFVPIRGDMLEEQWPTKNGQVVHYPLPAYGIATMEEAAVSIGKMIEREISNFIQATLHERVSNGFVWDTYMTAFRRAGNAPTGEERSLLNLTLRLWVLCRINCNSEHIVGEDKLDTPTVVDPDSPYHDSVPASPVLNAQLECIYYTKFLRPWSESVLQLLRSLMEANRREYWLTIYLTLFLLLHSCSMTTRRDKEYASQISLPATFCNPKGINEHNYGSKTLLAQFHMALKGGLPFQQALAGGHQAQKLSDMLTPSEIDFVRSSAIQAAALSEFSHSRQLVYIEE
ncbi:unnamed protein product [Clonostachys byssicola]|uniref:Uncharacterized protein n=1 Tax=Clonostachys byssicola TaxID=160290 RepID=A0A9N9UAC9_9HYPO|nr:unnamed protein product [Clonostachys byssicola]